MKLELSLLVLFLYLNINIINCQQYIQAFHFKPNRNQDFAVGQLGDIPLEYGVVNSALSDKPEYCCGDNPTIRSYDDKLIINNASTFGQWFKSSIDPNTGFCHNYGLLLESSFYLGYDGQILVENINSQLNGKAFNNATEFPDEFDEYTDLFCWYTQIYLGPKIQARVRATARDTGEIYVSVPGELLVYRDGFLIFEILGVDDISTIISAESDSLFEFFGCSRSGNTIDISLSFINFDSMCTNYNYECKTCGPAESCVNNCIDDDLTKCVHSQVECGVCNYNKIRNCDDNDPCTTDLCIEGEGCQHDTIEDCEGCIENQNCITTDLCYPKRCIEQLCIEEAIQCYSNETCFEPLCTNGECICSPIPTEIVTTTIDTTIASTIATTTASTIATTTATTITASIISTTSETTIGSTIATTTASTIATTTASTIATTGQTTDTLTSSISNSPSYLTQCNSLTCPHHYCCVQINSNSFTCISKYFEENCSPDRLKLFNK